MRHNEGSWIEPAIHIIPVICAVLVALGIVTAIHFVLKFW